MAEVAALGLRVDGVSNVDQAEKSLSSFSKSAASAEKSSSQLAKTSGGLNSAYDRLNGSLSRAAKSMLALGAATVSLAAASRTLSGFEDSMAQVAAITRATTDELKAMREMAKSLGATTKFSASEAADGIRFLGMAGFSASESLASIPAVLNLATASAMGLADAADIATNIMSGFGIEAQNAANVADVLAAASSRSNTTVQQLGGAMSTVAPISAALGISLEDTAAAIGTLSDAGIQGERAGTAMRGALASLAGPTTQAQAALRSLGLTVQDVNPQTNDLATIFGRLNEAGLNTAQAMTIFGREAASGALVLTQAAGRVGEFGDELRNAAGEAQRMADIMADSLAGDYKNFESVIEGIIIALGGAGLTAVMRSVIQLGTEIIRSLTDLVNAFGKVTSFIGSAMEPALNALGHVLTTVAGNVDAIVVAMAAMYAPAVLGGIATLTKAIGVGLVGAVNTLTAAMTANPIGFLIRVLATAATAIYVFRDDINKALNIDIVQSFRNMALGAAGIMDMMYAGFFGNISAIGALFRTLTENISTMFSNVFNRIREAASEWVFNLAQELNKLPFVNIEAGIYVGPEPKGYKDLAEEARKAFEAGQKALGARDALVGWLADDTIWNVGTQAFEDYTKAVNELSGGGVGEGSGGGGLPAATDALRKWLAESQNATAAANLMTAAYLQGGEAIASATRQLQIEQQVLEHGESARNAVTAAINAQNAALDRQDIAQQINDLREQNKAAQDYLAVLAAQSRGHQQGRQALAAFNREQAQAAILAGKTADEVADLVAQYDRLFVESQAIQDATSAMNELNRLVESTRTSQEKYNIELQRLVALRPYAQTAEQAEALERAIANIQRENSQWISFTEDALERINKSFADMWRDAFEGSRNAFEGMKRGFRQMLAEMAHAAITQPIMITVGNALMGTNNAGGILDGGGIFGALNTARTGMTAGSSLGNAAQWLGQKVGSEALTSFGLGLSGTTAATGIATIGTSLGASLGTSIGTSAAAMTTTTFSASLSGGAGASAAAGGAAGLGSTLGAALPWIGGGLAIASAFGLFDDRIPTTRRSQQGASHMLPDGSWEVSSWDDRQSVASQEAARDFAQAAVKHADELFKRIGVDAQIYSFMTLMESSILGDKQGVGSSGILRLGESLIDIGLAVESSWTRHGVGGWSDAEMLPRLMADINLTLLEAFQKAGDELPSILSGMLEGVDIRSLDISQAEQLIEAFQRTIDQIESLGHALDNLPFENLHNLSFDMRASLLEFAGGWEALSAGLNAYHENFFTVEEKLEHQVNQIARAFDGLSFTLPDVYAGGEQAMAQFRAIAESLDVNTQEGAKTFATMMSVAGSFAEAAKTADSLNGVMRDSGVVRDSSNALREREGLERRLLALQGDTEALRKRELDALDPMNRALQERIWALEDNARINEQRVGLEFQLNQLIGETTSLRARELDALDKTNRGLQQAIWGIQDAQNALTASYNALQQQTRDQITALQGSFRETDGIFRALQQSGEAAKRALQETFGATDDVFNALRDSAQRAKQELEETFSKTDAAYQSLQNAAQKLQQDLQGVFDALSGHIRDLRGEVESTSQMQYDQARAVISTALVTGQLPQSADLNEALQVARDGVANQTYASRFDQDRAYIRLANEMEALKDIAEPELDAATKTLEQAERQYNALRGIEDTSNASLDTLRAQLTSAISAEEAARKQMSDIDRQLQLADEQYNALRGIEDLSGLSFEALQSQLASAIATEEAAREQIAGIDKQLEQAAEQVNALRGIEDLSGLSFEALKEQLGIAISTEEAAREQIGVLEADLEVARGQYEALMGIQAGVMAFPAALERLGSAIKAGQDAAAAAAQQAALLEAERQAAAQQAQQQQQSGAQRSRELQYLADNPDVMAQYGQHGRGMTLEEYARTHYNLHGRAEGRAFARGGLATPGWALVGEEGPELVNFSQTGRVYSASHSEDIMRSMMGGGAAAANARVVQVLQNMFDYMKGKQQQEYQDSLNLKRTADRLDTLEQAVMNNGGLVMVGY